MTDAKRLSILESALGAFAAYGFKKCSMADIADAAGVSRPALYQHFSNKSEIYRAAAAHMQAVMVADAAETGASDAPLSDRLGAMLILYKGKIWHILTQTPHGRELIDLNTALAEDITLKAIEEITDLLAQAMAPHAAPGWDVSQAARLITSAARARMEVARTQQEFERDMQALGTIFAAAIMTHPA